MRHNLTTRLEPELREIEDRLKSPRKGQIVTPNEMNHVRIQREREKKRDAVTKELGRVIKCSWVDTELNEKGLPVQWEIASAIVEIGPHQKIYTVLPKKEIDGKERLDPRLVSDGYKATVEKWAIWKWHTLRGSEVDDADHYIADCDLPKFEWASPKTK